MQYDYRWICETDRSKWCQTFFGKYFFFMCISSQWIWSNEILVFWQKRFISKPCRCFFKTDYFLMTTTSIYNLWSPFFFSPQTFAFVNNEQGMEICMRAHGGLCSLCRNESKRENDFASKRNPKRLRCEKLKIKLTTCFFRVFRISNVHISRESHKNQWYLPKYAVKICGTLRLNVWPNVKKNDEKMTECKN